MFKTQKVNVCDKKKKKKKDFYVPSKKNLPPVLKERSGRDLWN